MARMHSFDNYRSDYDEPKTPAHELNDPLDHSIDHGAQAKALKLKLQEAQAQCDKLKARINTLRGDFHNVQARQEQHRAAVARALADGLKPPIDTERGQIDPQDAVKILEAELAKAEVIRGDCEGKHRTACVAYIRHELEGAFVGVDEAVDAYREALVNALALDKILVQLGIPASVSGTTHSTIIMAARWKDCASDCAAGQALNGRVVHGSQDVFIAAQEIKRKAVKACGGFI